MPKKLRKPQPPGLSRGAKPRDDELAILLTPELLACLDLMRLTKGTHDTEQAARYRRLKAEGVARGLGWKE